MCDVGRRVAMGVNNNGRVQVAWELCIQFVFIIRHSRRAHTFCMKKNLKQIRLQTRTMRAMFLSEGIRHSVR